MIVQPLTSLNNRLRDFIIPILTFFQTDISKFFKSSLRSGQERRCHALAFDETAANGDGACWAISAFDALS